MNLLVTIVDRSKSDDILNLFEEENINVLFVSLGKGTANSEILSYIGLGETEKTVILALTQKTNNILEVLKNKEDFTKQGGGVCFTIPLSSIGKNTLDIIKNSPEVNNE